MAASSLLRATQEIVFLHAHVSATCFLVFCCRGHGKAAMPQLIWIRGTHAAIVMYAPRSRSAYVLGVALLVRHCKLICLSSRPFLTRETHCMFAAHTEYNLASCLFVRCNCDVATSGSDTFDNALHASLQLCFVLAQETCQWWKCVAT